MNDEIKNRLKAIKIEDFIWIIYIIIIILSFYANSLEKKYFISKNQSAKEKYREIIIFIFSILIVVYSYFLISSINDIKNLKESDSLKKRKLEYLSFIASLLILISGIIFLYIAINDENIDVELAFN